MNCLNKDILTQVLSKMLWTKIVHTDYQSVQLHGGTLGDVKLVTATAINSKSEKM